jgi:tetratricopeptide (TPR) repeat protein
MANEFAVIEAAQRARGEFLSSGNRASLAESVRLGRAALAAMSDGGKLQGAAANDLAASLGVLYEATGEMRHLDEMITCLGQALKLLPPGDDNRAAAYTNTTGARLRRFFVSGDPDDVRAAVAAARQAIEASQRGAPKDAVRYNNLVGALRTLHDVTNDPLALDESITVGRIAVAAIQPSTDGQPLILASLAGSLQQRGVRTSSPDDVEECIEIARRAVAIAPPSSPWYRTAGSILAAALRAKAQMTGDLSSLSEAVVLQRENADLVPKEYSERALHLLQLAATLLVRYEWQEDWDDLVAAEEAVRQAMDSSNALVALQGWSVRANCWRYRAGKLASNGDRTGAEHAANQGVDAARKSLSSSTSMAGGVHSAHLVVECNALAARYELTGTDAHRAEAITAYRHAVEGLGAGTDHGGLAMLNLASLLMREHESRAVAEQDVAAAMRLLRQVLDAAERGARNWSEASVLMIRGQQLLRKLAPDSFDSDDLEVLYQQAIQARAIPPRRRAAVGTMAGIVLMESGDVAAAARILTDVARELPVVAWRGARRGSRESALQMFTQVGTHAAACHLAAAGAGPESAANAVEVLEQGRALLWADMLELRRTDTELGESQPELAVRLRDLARVLDTSDDVLENGLDGSRAADQRMAAATAWDETVAKIRERTPGFLRPVRLADLLTDAAQGPVVVVNTSDLRCDALIATSSGVRCVPLPSLSTADIRRHTTRYLSAFASLDQEDDAEDVGQSSSADPEHVLSEVLEWLWDAVAEPVLAALGIHGAPAAGQSWPRIWWCPTGLLSLLPLHAAGYHASPSGDGAPPCTVLDRAISSYTPTLGALAGVSPADAEDGAMLFVGVPGSPGSPGLPGASYDRDYLAKLLGPRCTVLFAEDATVRAVSAALSSHRWVHFSCHGQQDLAAPSRAGLGLWDGTLTVAGLSAPGHNGQFAFLAACQTATGGAALPDEAISLANAIHYAGYRHVVATLWAASDFAVAELTRMVYGDLASSGRLRTARSAEAVHSAVRCLRDSERSRPSWWAPFIHIGP